MAFKAFKAKAFKAKAFKAKAWLKALRLQSNKKPWENQKHQKVSAYSKPAPVHHL